MPNRRTTLGGGIAAGMASLMGDAFAADEPPRRGRLPTVPVQDYTPEQKASKEGFNRWVNPEGDPRGPFGVLMHTPNINNAALKMYEAIRRQNRIEPRLIELMVCIVARASGAEYEWFIHSRFAVEQGVAPEIIEAIRVNKTPTFAKEDERVLYLVVHELLASSKLSAVTYEKGLAFFGREKLVEIVAGAGYFKMLGFLLTAFAVPPPSGPLHPFPDIQ